MRYTTFRLAAFVITFIGTIPGLYLSAPDVSYLHLSIPFFVLAMLVFMREKDSIAATIMGSLLFLRVLIGGILFSSLLEREWYVFIFHPFILIYISYLMFKKINSNKTYTPKVELTHKT
ncbi:hypothetical protein N9R79_11870 [Vibrio sp.]|nr:hypothetical protein [Vibrio sp.]